MFPRWYSYAQALLLSFGLTRGRGRRSYLQGAAGSSGAAGSLEGRERRSYLYGAAGSLVARCFVLHGEDRTGLARFLLILLLGCWCPGLPFLALALTEPDPEASCDLGFLLVRCCVSGVLTLVGKSDGRETSLCGCEEDRGITPAGRTGSSSSSSFSRHILP
ncbi:hypothetical protein F5B17DRAFT_409773 [Nemania serpens]|nr:hypothetical protein F5B17DRAFT_409773 [Nemania serpens]